MLISIVVPVYNEEESIGLLYEEIREVEKRYSYDFEIIIVDDGSRDNTQKVVREFKNSKVITLRRNYGQSAAMTVGLQNASGEYVIFMDGDGQNSPSDIPTMLEKFQNEGLDLLCGWRATRRDPFMKKFLSQGARILRSYFLKDFIHDSGCTLKIAKSSSIREIDIRGELHRFIPALMVMEGFSVSEIVVSHRPRVHGKTKYNWRRIPKGFLDILNVWFWSKFKLRPFHFFGGVAFAMFFLGIVLGLIAVILYLSDQLIFRNVLPIITMMLFLSGIQFLILGIIADSFSRLVKEEYASDRYQTK